MERGDSTFLVWETQLGREDIQQKGVFCETFNIKKPNVPLYWETLPLVVIKIVRLWLIHWTKITFFCLIRTLFHPYNEEQTFLK